MSSFCWQFKTDSSGRCTVKQLGVSVSNKMSSSSELGLALLIRFSHMLLANVRIVGLYQSHTTAVTSLGQMGRSQHRNTLNWNSVKPQCCSHQCCTSWLHYYIYILLLHYIIRSSPTSGPNKDGLDVHLSVRPSIRLQKVFQFEWNLLSR